MKKMFLIISFIFSINACNVVVNETDTRNIIQVKDNIQVKFPNYKFLHKPINIEDKYTFIVVDSSDNIWLVKSNELNNNEINVMEMCIKQRK